MTQNEKEMLLNDLSARLPYGVKISIPDLWTQKREIEVLDEIFKGDDGIYRVNSKGQCIEYIQPYLFPMSSMSDEQENEWDKLHLDPLGEILEGKFNTKEEHMQLLSKSMTDPIQWCYKNHFDCNGLIPLGLAIDASNLNIY